MKTWALHCTMEDKGSEDWRIYKAPKSANDMHYKSVIPKIKTRYEKQRMCSKPEVPIRRRKTSAEAAAAHDAALSRHRAKARRVTASWARAAKKALS